MSAPVSPSQPIPEPVRQHTPTPWTYELVNFSGECNLHGRNGEEFALLYVSDGADEPEPYPAEANATLIVEAVNSHASLKARVEELEAAQRKSNDALSDWLAFAEEELGEFDLEVCDFGGATETLCHKCESSGCINLKIRNTRAALPQSSGVARG